MRLTANMTDVQPTSKTGLANAQEVHGFLSIGPYSLTAPAQSLKTA
jgi:hypothetical protein